MRVLWDFWDSVKAIIKEAKISVSSKNESADQTLSDRVEPRSIADPENPLNKTAKEILDAAKQDR